MEDEKIFPYPVVILGVISNDTCFAFQGRNPCGTYSSGAKYSGMDHH
jgi:hypothetical protein